MKTKYWLLIFAGISLLLFIFLLTITLVLEISWWWLGGTAILYSLIGGTIGVIYLVKYGNKKEEVKPKLDPEKGKEIFKSIIMNDKDNPDIFVIDKARTSNEGMVGLEKTNVLVAEGYTYWGEEKLFGLLDLSEKSKYALLREPTSDEKKEALRKFALNPETEEKEEEVFLSDITGNPFKKIIKTRQLREQKIQEKEREKAEEEIAV